MTEVMPFPKTDIVLSYESAPEPCSFLRRGGQKAGERSAPRSMSLAYFDAA